MANIFWAGDSTVAYNSAETFPQTGIGQAFGLFLKPGVTIFNHAINGRSTKSFIDEGRLAPIYDSIQEGDFLFIQFAHNDEKEEDPARYTTPFGTYMENLVKFINAARDKKAIPVLITPIERRCFKEDGTLGPGKHGEYVKACKMVAEKEQVALVDLYSMSRELLSELGPIKAMKLHVVVPSGIYPAFPQGKNDGTHLCYDGAVRYSSQIAKGLQGLGGIYSELLLDVELF